MRNCGEFPQAEISINRRKGVGMAIDFIIRDLIWLRREHPWMKDTLTAAIEYFERLKEEEKDEG